MAKCTKCSAELRERYRIVALLGRGGMGEVYRADDLSLGQQVALKFLPEAVATNPDTIARGLVVLGIGVFVSGPRPGISPVPPLCSRAWSRWPAGASIPPSPASGFGKQTCSTEWGQPILAAAAFRGGFLGESLSLRPAPSQKMRHYERRLPHWDVVDQPLFVTFRLHGSLPANRVFPPERLTTGKAFVAMDRILDNARSGPTFLQQPDIATLVVAALHDGERRFGRYHLNSFVVMPNHVHILVTPRVIATRWLGPLKGFTAHEANRILGHTGTPFWQDESYDHLVRSDTEFDRVRAYIEQNPVRAGLATVAAQYRWSSAARTGAA